MSVVAPVAKLLAECISHLEAVLEAQHDVREDFLMRSNDVTPACNASEAPSTSTQENLSQRSLKDGEDASNSSHKATTESAAAAPSPSPKPNGPTTRELEERLGAATETATKTAHRLLVHSIHTNDCVDMCRNANFLVLAERVADVIGVGHDDHVLRQVGMDVNLAANVISMFANICVFEEARQIFPSPDLAISIALTAIRHQPTNKRIVHLCLTCISNVALCGDLPLLQDATTALVNAVVPIFDEAPVVEAWACAMCNVAATTVNNLHLLVASGAVKRLEALVQYHADNERVVARGFQCLSCLCAAHFGPKHVPPS